MRVQVLIFCIGSVLLCLAAAGDAFFLAKAARKGHLLLRKASIQKENHAKMKRETEKKSIEDKRRQDKKMKEAMRMQKKGSEEGLSKTQIQKRKESEMKMEAKLQEQIRRLQKKWLSDNSKPSVELKSLAKKMLRREKGRPVDLKKVEKKAEKLLQQERKRNKRVKDSRKKSQDDTDLKEAGTTMKLGRTVEERRWLKEQHLRSKRSPTQLRGTRTKSALWRRSEKSQSEGHRGKGFRRKGVKSTEEDDTADFNKIDQLSHYIPAMDTPNNEAVTAHQNDVLYGIEQTNKPLDEIANKPLDEIANKPLDENVSYSLDEIANKPLDEIVNKPLDENTNKPLNEIENKPLNEIANKPLDEIANKPLDEIENIPAVASNSLEDSEEELENEEENEVPEYTEEVVYVNLPDEEEEMVYLGEPEYGIRTTEQPSTPVREVTTVPQASDPLQVPKVTTEAEPTFPQEQLGIADNPSTSGVQGSGTSDHPSLLAVTASTGSPSAEEVDGSSSEEPEVGGSSSAEEVGGSSEGSASSEALKARPWDIYGEHDEPCGQAYFGKKNRRRRLRTQTITKILQGKEALPGSFPWQVAILDGDRDLLCGGTLIAPRWVMTASHCVRKRLFVRLSEHHIHEKDGYEIEQKVRRIFKHPNYNSSMIDNDIALLRLPALPPFPHNATGRVSAGVTDRACLPASSHEFPPVGTRCLVMGWGKASMSHRFGTDTLMYTRLPIISRKACEKANKKTITENMFCAGNYKGGSDTCSGDSGGPLLCSDGTRRAGERWTVYGVTSFGDGCGIAGQMGVYARVDNYLDWMAAIMNRYL